MKRIPMTQCEKCNTHIPERNCYFIESNTEEIRVCEECHEKWCELSQACVDKLFKRWIKKDDKKM